MFLEAETKVVIQDRLEVTISWKTYGVNKISPGAERILPEFVHKMAERDLILVWFSL